MFVRIMQRLVRWLDPLLDRFRPRKTPAKSIGYTPTSIKDFVEIINRTPKDILSTKDRTRIAAVMSFDDRTVSEVMIPRSEVIFVHDEDVLGPLMLDKLYKSGLTSFPVIDSYDHIRGIIHTQALNALESKQTARAAKYLDRKVCYLHASDSLAFVVSEIERTNSYCFLVLDDSIAAPATPHKDSIVGLFTIQQLLDYLLGK